MRGQISQRVCFFLNQCRTVARTWSHRYCERRLVVYWVGVRCSEPRGLSSPDASPTPLAAPASAPSLSSTLIAPSPSLLPFPIVNRANLCSRRSRHLRTQTRCRSKRTAKRRYLRFRKWDHQQSRAMASCTLLFPLALLILLPFSLLGGPASFLHVCPR